MKIALTTLDRKWKDKAYRLQLCAELSSLDAMAEANVVIFPEMTLTGFPMNTQLVAEDPGHSAFSAIATSEMTLFLAPLFATTPANVGNMFDAYSDKGIEHARYVDTHPFSLPFSTRQDRRLGFYRALL